MGEISEKTYGPQQFRGSLRTEQTTVELAVVVPIQSVSEEEKECPVHNVFSVLLLWEWGWWRWCWFVVVEIDAELQLLNGERAESVSH